MVWRRRPAYALPALAMIAFAGLLTFSLVRLIQVEQDMRSNVSENMLWVITQAQVASHRLDEEVHRLTLGDQAARPALRYDVLTSRLVLLDEGPQRRYLAALGFAERVDDAFERLAAIEPQLDAIAPDAVAAADSIHAELKPLMQDLNRIANAVMVEEWETTGERLDRHRDSTLQVIASVVGLMLCGLALGYLLIGALRQRRAAQQALAEHRDQLEVEVERRTQDLEAARHRVAAAIDTAPDAFAAFDTDGRLALVNPKLIQMLPEASRALPLGCSLEHALAVLRECDDNGELEDAANDPRERTLRCDLHITELGWLQLTMSASRDGGHVMRLADITPYKQATEALQRALQRERGVSDFYRSFAAMVSHQFRTPLAVIDSGLQRLQRRGERLGGEERQQRYRRLRDSVAHMTRLVGSSLTAARLDGGQIEAASTRCDLRQLAEQCCRLHGEASGTSRIHLSPGDDTPIMAYCDPVLVEQILTNLLSNALKYSPDDSAVEVCLGHDEASIYCAVRDHGRGIDAADQAQLFERFFRSSNATDQPGIGLGLNIARHLARIQHGDIDVHSRPGTGTTFRLLLPHADTAAIETGEAQ
ncbi:sensor histidine kinase [Halomonas salipaludis]|nr:PAS domain-containing sensor histidine kinase [Halomonas salipaludis]